MGYWVLVYRGFIEVMGPVTHYSGNWRPRVVLLRAQSGSYIITLGSKYLPYGYPEPLGLQGSVGPGAFGTAGICRSRGCEVTALEGLRVSSKFGCCFFDGVWFRKSSSLSHKSLHASLKQKFFWV